MFCTKCGQRNADDAVYCTQCGAGLAATSAPSPSPSPSPAAAPADGHPAAAAPIHSPPPVLDPRMRSGAAPAATSGKRIVVGKNPVVALVLSIFLGFWAVGQFYNGDWKKGLVMLALSVVGGVLTGGLVTLGVWVWSAVDAYQVAEGKWPAW